MDKPDNVDEIGQPINEESAEESLVFNYEQQHDLDFAEEVSSEKNEPESLTQVPAEIIDLEENSEPQQPDEGTDDKVSPDIFPQILPVPASKESEDLVENPIKYLKRSDSALNIFDQTTILKLFSAKNWTETFFNRIFRKKFLVISPGVDVLALNKGFDLEQQMMHFSQNYPRDFLPAIACSELDKKLTNDGLLPFPFQLLRMQFSFSCAICRLRILSDTFTISSAL